MSAPEIFRIGDDRLLCDHWHALRRTVVVRPGDPRRPPRCDAVRKVVDTLVERGVGRVITAALDDAGLAPFRAAGFAPLEQLCVYRHELVAPMPRCDLRTRRGGARRDRGGAALVDERAFADTNPLDVDGLAAVLAATPATRFRVIDGPGRHHAAVGYAVTGTAGNVGYLQRLAVDPPWQHQGFGRALVLDALDWCRRRRVGQVLVNTRADNFAARSLYRNVGFVPTTDRLAVWCWSPDRCP